MPGGAGADAQSPPRTPRRCSPGCGGRWVFGEVGGVFGLLPCPALGLHSWGGAGASLAVLLRGRGSLSVFLLLLLHLLDDFPDLALCSLERGEKKQEFWGGGGIRSCYPHKAAMQHFATPRF